MACQGANPQDQFDFDAPADVAGTFTINQPPVDQSVSPNSTVTFTVGTTTDVPLRYQWLRDGVEIPNATGASSILPRYSLLATPADNGARFSAGWVAGGGSANSFCSPMLDACT